MAFALQLFDRLRCIQLRGHQHTICMMNFPDARFCESPPLQTYGIQSIGVRSTLRGRPRKWQHVPRYGGAPADEGMRPNPNEVVHRAQRPYAGPVFHGYVPAERGCVGHDDVTPRSEEHTSEL